MKHKATLIALVASLLLLIFMPVFISCTDSVILRSYLP